MRKLNILITLLLLMITGTTGCVQQKTTIKPTESRWLLISSFKTGKIFLDKNSIVTYKENKDKIYYWTKNEYNKVTTVFKDGKRTINAKKTLNYFEADCHYKKMKNLRHIAYSSITSIPEDSITDEIDETDKQYDENLLVLTPESIYEKIVNTACSSKQ